METLSQYVDIIKLIGDHLTDTLLMAFGQPNS